MNNNKIAKELVKLAQSLMADETTDKPEDIAHDVWSRLVNNGETFEKAFKAIGYYKIYWKLKGSDLSDDFDSMSKEDQIKELTKAIEKALER